MNQQYTNIMSKIPYFILSILLGLSFLPTLGQPSAVIYVPISRNVTQATIAFDVDNGGYTILQQGLAYRLFSQSPSSNIFVNSGRIVAQDTVTLTGLSAGTRYRYLAYVVYDNSGSNDTIYSTESNFYTLATEPTSHVGFISITGANTNSVTVSYNAASNATHYGTFLKGGTPINPEQVVDGVGITGQTAGDMRQEISSTTFTRTGLLQDSTYSLTIIPINRVGFITATNNYYTSGNVSSITFRLAPTSQASNIVLQDFSGGTATIAWTSGNGNGRVLKMNTTNNFTAPTLGSYPTANSTWQNAGEQVVYNGNGNSATISGLSSNQTYWFRLYELNNPESGRALYNTQSATNNPTSLTTISAPSTQDYQISFSNLFTNQVTVSWTKGDGDYRIVVMNSTNSFTNPSNNTTYTTDDSWNNAGEQVVYNSSGNSVVVTNLQANNTYYFRVFAYNGTAGNEIYNLQTATNNPNSVSTSTNLTWTGQTSTDWSNANNWNPPMAPTNQHSVHIPIVSSQNYPIINSSVSVKNITIAPQAELTVSNGVTLSVVENFVIQGTSAGSGSLLVEGTGTVSVGQTSKFVRHTGSNNYWHFASTPTNNSDIKQFTGHYVNQWNETTQSWTQLNSSSSLQVMRGYSIKQYNRDTTVFTGNFNNGLKSIAVTNSGSGSYPGLNIIGNPYPSAIDWKSPNGWTRNYIDPTIYVYHTQSQTYYTYNYQTNVASPASFDGIVPAGNGYYIIAQQNTTLSTTNDVRVHSSQSFYKNQTSPQWPLIRFNATNDKNMDELVIFFHPEAPEKITYDCRFSAIKLFPEEMQEKPYIYAKTNTETYPNLAVVALNEKLLNRLAAGETIDIPVTIGSRTTKQAVTITEENIQNDYSYSLYNPFSKKEDLLFSHTEVESGDYILRIKQKSTTLNINESLTNNDAFILVRDNKIYVTNNQNINNSIIVTDISGRMIENGTVGAYETIVIDMNQKSGMFVVTILNSKRLITKKVLIP